MQDMQTHNYKQTFQFLLVFFDIFFTSSYQTWLAVTVNELSVETDHLPAPSIAICEGGII